MFRVSLNGHSVCKQFSCVSHLRLTNRQIKQQESTVKNKEIDARGALLQEETVSWGQGEGPSGSAPKPLLTGVGSPVTRFFFFGWGGGVSGFCALVRPDELSKKFRNFLLWVSCVAISKLNSCVCCCSLWFFGASWSRITSRLMWSSVFSQAVLGLFVRRADFIAFF